MYLCSLHHTSQGTSITTKKGSAGTVQRWRRYKDVIGNSDIGVVLWSVFLKDMIIHNSLKMGIEDWKMISDYKLLLCLMLYEI
jgi:hypothetical protein